MRAKLGAWGATLLVYGIGSLLLPLIGMQLRIFNLFGAEQTKVGIGCIAVGAGLWLVARSRTPRAEQEPRAAPAVQAPAAAPAAATLACPKCGAVANPGDRFCMECGSALAQPVTAVPAYVAPAVPAAAVPRRRLRLGRLFLLLLLLGIVGAALWFFYGPAKSYKPPTARAEPAMPARLAGTLAEFPVDPATTNRLEPVSVVSQTFPGSASVPAGSSPGAPPLGTPSLPPSTPVGPYGSPAPTPSAPTMQAPPVSFPPGMNAGQIPQVATAATSTTYQSNEPQAPPVYVHVLQVGPNVTIALQFAQGIAQSAGVSLQGARVQSPSGQIYDGYTVRSPGSMVYVLTHPSAGNVIILYTPQPTGFPAVQRLAGSVGNGRGLRDYPQVVDTYSALPASAPPGYSLTGMRSFTGSQLTSALSSAVGQAQAQAGQKEAVELNKVLQSVRPVIPDHGTLALYGNGQGQEKGVLVASFRSPKKASVAWRALSWTLGWAMKKNKDLGFTALEGDDSQSRYLLFQKGPYIALAKVPAGSGAQDLLALARSLQI